MIRSFTCFLLTLASLQASTFYLSPEGKDVKQYQSAATEERRS